MNSKCLRHGWIALCFGFISCGSDSDAPHLSSHPPSPSAQTNAAPVQTAQVQPPPAPSTPNAPTSNSGSLLTAPVDYMASSIRAGNQAKGTLELIAIRKAIDAYQQETGKFPESLDELVEKKYLNVLAPPPPNQQYHYDPAAGTVTLVPK